jgi:hypothetical protein
MADCCEEVCEEVLEEYLSYNCLIITNPSLLILSNFFILLTFLINIRPQQLVMNIRSILKILQYPVIIY